MAERGFDAFISYSHRDMKWGRWLQRRLESYSVPRAASDARPEGGKLRVFRDQTDLAGVELQSTLRRELDASKHLIVICSPASAASTESRRARTPRSNAFPPLCGKRGRTSRWARTCGRSAGTRRS